MRRLLWMTIVGSALGLAPGTARAQVGPGAVVVAGAPARLNGVLAAPGLYGMSYGVPSVGLTRTYSSFSSPYGPGYGYGYAPYGLLPGKYGVGLWRPAFLAPGYLYGASYYQTFAVPFSPGPVSTVAPIGAFAPGFGPPSYYGW